MEYFTTEKIEGTTVIRFRFNEINLEQREALKEKLTSLLNTNDAKFILNLSKIGFLSSLVITTILFFAKEARQRNKEVKLCEPTKDGQTILQIMHLNKIFEAYETEREAIESFK